MQTAALSSALTALVISAALNYAFMVGRLPSGAFIDTTDPVELSYNGRN